MISVHGNFIIGNGQKMLYLRHNGLWIAAPSVAVYSPPSLNLTEEMLTSIYSIKDREGIRYDLEHINLEETRWGKCVEYVEH